MFIVEAFELLKYLINQDQARYTDPDEFATVINRASYDYYTAILPLYEKDENITALLQQFKTKSDPIALSNGVADLPEDFGRNSFGEVLVMDGSTVESSTEANHLKDNVWSKKKTDLIAPPTSAYPIYRIVGGQLEVMPEDSTHFRLYYLKKPTLVTLTVTPVGDDYVIDQNNSTDLDWSVLAHKEILFRAMGYIGVSLKDSLLLQYESNKEQIRSNKV